MDILCGRCKKNMTKYISLPCMECINSKEYQYEMDKQNKNWKTGKQLVGRFKEPTAFGVKQLADLGLWINRVRSLTRCKRGTPSTQMIGLGGKQLARLNQRKNISYD